MSRRIVASEERAPTVIALHETAPNSFDALIYETVPDEGIEITFDICATFPKLKH